MRVEVVAVGTELLLGDLVDTNTAWIGQRLAAAGIDLVGAMKVGDNRARIAAAVTGALGRAEAVVVTGGLGPTQDDLTRAALADVGGVPLVRDEALADALRARFAGADPALVERNLQQAELPAGATALANDRGSAPGLRLEQAGRVVYALPGVPTEMRAMFLRGVLPELVDRAGAHAVTVSRVLRTAGVGESAVAQALAELDARLDAAPGGPTLAYLASAGEVVVRITAKAQDPDSATARIAPIEAEVRQLLGDAVYGADGESLDTVVHRLLRARGATVAVAESLTGGLLGGRLTEMPGSSETFRGGVVAYATALKGSLLGVPEPLLATEGPVSPRTAIAMAEGVRRALGASYGVALTGVAGPEPQDGHPIGELHVAVAGPDRSEVTSLALQGDRQRIRQLAVTRALDLLRRRLAAEEPA